jgi:ribosomal protein L7/L12
MNVPQDIENTLRELVQSNRKIEAIKLLRDASGCQLKEAKDYVDNLDAPHDQFVAAQPADRDKHLLMLLSQGKKIEAVKYYKDQTGAGLADSKNYVDHLQEYGTPPPVSPRIPAGGTAIDKILRDQQATQKKATSSLPVTVIIILVLISIFVYFLFLR